MMIKMTVQMTIDIMTEM